MPELQDNKEYYILSIYDVICAIIKHDLDTLNFLIPNYYPVNMRIMNHGTLLIYAIENNCSIKMIRELLSLGASVHEQYLDRYPIDIAIIRRRSDIIYELVKYGSSVTHKHVTYLSPLRNNILLDEMQYSNSEIYQAIRYGLYNKAFNDGKNSKNLTIPFAEFERDHRDILKQIEVYYQNGIDILVQQKILSAKEQAEFELKQAKSQCFKQRVAFSYGAYINFSNQSAPDAIPDGGAVERADDQVSALIRAHKGGAQAIFIRRNPSVVVTTHETCSKKEINENMSQNLSSKKQQDQNDLCKEKEGSPGFPTVFSKGKIDTDSSEPRAASCSGSEMKNPNPQIFGNLLPYTTSRALASDPETQPLLGDHSKREQHSILDSLASDQPHDLRRRNVLPPAP